MTILSAISDFLESSRKVDEFNNLVLSSPVRDEVFGKVNEVAQEVESFISSTAIIQMNKKADGITKKDIDSWN